MRTHKQIIKDAGGPSAVAKVVVAEANTAKGWSRSNSIPAMYWEPIVAAHLATLEELAAAAAARRSV